MILNRLAQNVRSQNWFAVSVELVVVVAGIFIAVQVDRLYDGYREAELARVYVGQLREDIAQNRERYIDTTEVIARKIGALEQLREILSEPQAEIDKDSIAGIVRSSTIFGWLVPLSQARTATFDEMRSSGNLIILDDVRLQGELLDYYNRLERQTQRVQERQTEYPRLVQRLAPPSVVTLPANFTASELASVSAEIDAERMISRLRAGGAGEFVDAELIYAIELGEAASEQLQLAIALEERLTQSRGR